jgi:hypothetical protein
MITKEHVTEMVESLFFYLGAAATPPMLYLASISLADLHEYVTIGGTIVTVGIALLKFILDYRRNKKKDEK